MDYTIITVPDMNDSVSRVVLDGVAYQIRFTYNMLGDYWKFSLLDSLGNAIVLGVKIVPNFPLNLFSGGAELPLGVFAALTKLDRIGRKDFADDKAKFIYCPADQ